MGAGSTGDSENNPQIFYNDSQNPSREDVLYAVTWDATFLHRNQNETPLRANPQHHCQLCIRRLYCRYICGRPNTVLAQIPLSADTCIGNQFCAGKLYRQHCTGASQCSHRALCAKEVNTAPALENAIVPTTAVIKIAALIDRAKQYTMLFQEIKG